MRRREFIAGLGGAVVWPRVARAQQPALPMVGYLSGASAEGYAHLVAAFRKGLSESGFVEGHNVAIEYRWANNRNDRLPELANDLVHRRVAVIATPISTPASLAAKAATSTIPIVFGIGGDPVQAGLVASLNRPGGNATGVTQMGRELGGKHVEFLHQVLPRASRFAVLVNPTNPLIPESYVADVRAAAPTFGGQIEVLTASTDREIDAVYALLATNRFAALLVSPDGLFISRRMQLIMLAMRHAMPAINAGRILKGEKPGDLPVQQATNIELVINLKTVKALDLTVPETLLATADEVIQ
jgi:putative ABC transport system substrate-binding protein